MFNNEAIRRAVAFSSIPAGDGLKRADLIGAAAEDMDLCPYCGETISRTALEADRNICPIPSCRQYIRPGMLTY